MTIKEWRNRIKENGDFGMCARETVGCGMTLREAAELTKAIVERSTVNHAEDEMALETLAAALAELTKKEAKG